MRLRHIPGAAAEISKSPLVLTEQAASLYQGKWRELSGGRPCCLEIGMGRGRFIFAAAQASEDFYIGLEIRPEMIFQALERFAAEEGALPGCACPDNLRLLWCDAARLTDLFAPGELSRIYLNFPDPWPKSRHHKRRLTAPAFLQQYRSILAQDGELRFKTDNRALFDWSLGSLKEAGWRAEWCSYDLPLADSGIITEYESRYRACGQPIYAVCAKPV